MRKVDAVPVDGEMSGLGIFVQDVDGETSGWPVVAMSRNANSVDGDTCGLGSTVETQVEAVHINGEMSLYARHAVSVDGEMCGRDSKFARRAEGEKNHPGVRVTIRLIRSDYEQLHLGGKTEYKHIHDGHGGDRLQAVHVSTRLEVADMLASMEGFIDT